MPKFFVVTPPYERYPGSPYGWEPEPPEYGSDVAEVEAPDKAKARVLGLRELRRMRSDWVRDMESDKRCPFNGLTIHEAE